MRWLNAILLGLLTYLTAVSDVYAERRVALVIGNGAYRNAPALANPLNDALDVSNALARSGFEVISKVNLDQLGMQEALITFAREARSADVAMFYYSGHALQFAGTNYLAPIDAVLRDEADLKRLTRVDEILADLQQAKNLRILVLNSCRDNPFAEDLKRSLGRTRSTSLSRGLAKMESPDGTIISYATQAGRTADDGSGRNSPYTGAFLKHIEDKDNITTLFQRIGAKVYKDTKGLQVPELSLSFFGELYLNGKNKSASLAVPATPAVDPCAGAAESWRNSDGVGTLAAYRDHLVQYPSCAYAAAAQSKVAALSKSETDDRSTKSFDGTWIINEVCDKRAPIWPAKSYQFAGTIKDGLFTYQYGADGSPASGIFEGKMETDGTGEISVRGFTGSTELDPLHRNPGTHFSYKIAIKLDGALGSGAGVRTDTPRLCRSVWSRLSATTPIPSNANSEEREKPQVGSASDGASAKRKSASEPKSGETVRTRATERTSGVDSARREPAPSANRPSQTNLSCTTLRGKCAVACVATTGLPNCAATVCVNLQQQCLNTGCWRGKSFSSCGLIRQ